MQEVAKATFDLDNERVVLYVSYPSPVYFDSVEGAQDDVVDISEDVARWISRALGGRARPKPCIVLGTKTRVVVSKEIPLTDRQITRWTTLNPFGEEKAQLQGILGRAGFHLS